MNPWIGWPEYLELEVYRAGGWFWLQFNEIHTYPGVWRSIYFNILKFDNGRISESISMEISSPNEFLNFPATHIHPWNEIPNFSPPFVSMMLQAWNWNCLFIDTLI